MKINIDKWIRPHIMNFYIVLLASIIFCIGCTETLPILTTFESLVVVSFMFTIITLNVSMWNTCMFRQHIEHIETWKSETNNISFTQRK